MTTRKPGLFIVGAPRCGTSALFDLIGQHPHVCASDPKEPHYFCTDFHEESDRYFGKRLRFPVRTEPQYLALFRDGSRPVLAEATTANLYSRVAAENIRAFNPDARIIIMVREPVEMLRSLHAKLLSRGFEPLGDFRLAIEAEPRRRAGAELPTGLFFPSSLHYSEWIRFSEQIERYRSRFPADRVKIVIYDDFQRDNMAVYADVMRFAGLDSAFRPGLRRVNENRTVRFEALSRAVERIGNSAVVRLLPWQLRRRVGRAVRNSALNATKRAPPDPGLRRALMARFRPEVERLGQVLDRDLITLWGYD